MLRSLALAEDGASRGGATADRRHFCLAEPPFFSFKRNSDNVCGTQDERRGLPGLVWTTKEPGAAPDPPAPDADSLSTTEESFALVALKRGSRVEPMSTAITPKEGDIATVAIYEVEGDEARGRLAALGWLPVEEEEGGDEPEAQAPAK